MRSVIQKAIDDGALHHAYLLRSDSMPDGILTLLSDYSNANIVIHDDHQLKVDTARSIRDMATRTHDGVRVVVIKVKGATSQAQNALLKAIEEPIPGVHFFLIVPHSVVVLDTIRSRCIEISDSQTLDEGYACLVDMTYDKRKKAIAKILDEDSPRIAAQELLRRECGHVHAREHEQRGVHLENIEWANQLLSKPGSSTKLILEHLIAIL